MKTLKISPVFSSLIPPLTPEEYATLEESCISQGIRDNICTWNGTIIDGHNRYEIAQRHNLHFEALEKDFDSDADVKIWMIDNQKGRRNLTDFVKYELAQVKADIIRERGRQAKIDSGKLFGEGHPKEEVLSIVDKTSQHNTQKEIAKELGWSTGKVAMADIVNKEAAEETKDKLRKAEISINAVYKDIKRKKQVEKQKKVKIDREQTNKIDKKYTVIYCDPPWKYDHSKTKSRDIENQYPTMDIKELKELNIPNAPDSVLFLWATAPKLNQAIDLMTSWGYEYKTCAVWDKEIIGMGYWLRGQHELLLIGTAGSPGVPNTENRVSSVYREKRGKHSKKPDYYYKLIESMFPDASKIELFARNKVDGFDCWGNERL